MGTHSTTRGPRSLAAVLGILVVIAVLGTVVWAIVRQDEPPPPAAAAGCETEVAVRVTTTADFAPLVEAAAERLESGDAAGCAAYEVDAASSAATTELVRAGADSSHVWIPESDLWVERANEGRTAAALTVGPTLATSPVVIAVPGPLAEQTQVTGEQPWAAVLGELPLRIDDPERSTASLFALLGASQALGATPEGQQALGAATIRLSRQLTPQDELFSQASAGAAGATAFPATEQQIFTQRAENPDAPLEAVVPESGAGSFTYSWVVMPAAERDDSTRQAVAALEQSLTGVAGVAERREAGFRAPDGGDVPGVPGVPTELATAAPTPSVEAVNQVLTSFRTVSVDMRMIAAVDVSGSMLQPAGDESRIELAAASAQAAMQVFPPSSKVGLWVFSTDHDNGLDWTELAPIAQLDAASGSGTHRDALLAAAATLPQRTRADADTGLYDTILAAYKTVQQNYEPGYVNSVVVLTDGMNEDDVSISLEQLLAQLQALTDPSRPIPVITVGMGPEADASVLRLISAQTGGRSYIAEDPTDIGTVFVDALLHRLRTG